MKTPLQAIPPVHRFTSDPLVASFDGLLGHATVRARVQSVLDAVREQAVDGGAVAGFPVLRDLVVVELARAQAQGLIPVINGTGVLLHTNFGRAPLASAALAAATALGRGYTNLEYDLNAGRRGSRYDRVSDQLRELTAAPAALVVNNCAAAVLLVLDTFARGREVIVSRGQLIEIGGGFRLPDVLRKGGATLVEVGTTNKTYADDYRAATGPDTALLMRTHPSNYRIGGFTAEVSSKELAALAHELGVLAFEDLGSGALVDLQQFGLEHEPTVAEEIAAGMDLVAFSGDKLLGGPQCGLIAGRIDLIATLKRNPLLRALRTDKLTLAALSATLGLYLERERLHEIPFFAMLQTPVEEIEQRAHALVARLDVAPGQVAVIATQAATGGGTLPLARLPSAGVRVTPAAHNLVELTERLRAHRPPVIGRIEGDALVLDLRCVRPDEDAHILHALSCTL